MKIKKTFFALALAFCLVVPTTFVMTACGHKHTYSQNWSSDAEYHWHAATCEHTTEKNDIVAHTFGEWTETKAPTYTEKGEKQRTCSICLYKDKQEINKLDAKENSLTLAEGVSETEFYKEYDKQGIALTKEMFVYNGNGELTFEFKKNGETTFSKTSPVTAGEYIVKVTVAGTSEWKTISKEYNYSIDKKKISIEDQEFQATYVGKEWKVNLVLDNTNGILDGDSVSLELFNDNDWIDGSSFDLYADDAQMASDRERVRLVGNDANNYEFEPFDSYGDLKATLICNIQKTQVNGSCYSSLWGTFPVADLKCGFCNFKAGGVAGSFAEKLFEGENAYKQLTIKVNAIVGTETTCIAMGTRIGLGDSTFGYEYTGMTFIDNADKTKVAFSFNLLANVEGFTDEDGKWIYEGEGITLKLMVADDTKTIELCYSEEEKENKTAFAGKLVDGAYIVAKFNLGEGSYKLNFDETIVANIGIYSVSETGLSPITLEGEHEFYLGGYEDVCYIAIKVTTGITGGMTITSEGL